MEGCKFLKLKFSSLDQMEQDLFALTMEFGTEKYFSSFLFCLETNDGSGTSDVVCTLLVRL